MPARIAGVKPPKALAALGRPTASGLGQQHGKKNMRPVNLQAVRSKNRPRAWDKKNATRKNSSQGLGQIFAGR